MKDLYFHRYAKNKKGEPLNSVICKTECITRKPMAFNGKPGFSRTQGSAEFCLLIITDEDGNTVDPRQYEFEQNQILEGICNSGAPVIDQETGQETGLFWAEPYEKTQAEGEVQ